MIVMANEPKLMDLSRMRDIFTPHLAQMHKKIYFNRELGILHGDSSFFEAIMQQGPPFIINDHRFGMVLAGEGHINFNLHDRVVKAGTLVYLGPGTIINPIGITENLEIYGTALFADFPMPFTASQMPSAFNGQVRDIQIQVEPQEIVIARNILDTIWQVVNQPDYHRPTVTSLVAALMHHYDALFNRQFEQLMASRSREQTVLDRFLQLVNEHCSEEHQIGYYARRMCLTERYLSTVIRQASGTTAKDWIDRALVMRIKAELRHSSKSAATIADEMHFPNASFFSKYFKRLTGMTPVEYRLS